MYCYRKRALSCALNECNLVLCPGFLFALPWLCPKLAGKPRSAVSSGRLQLDGGFLKNEAIHCYKHKSHCQIEPMKITLPSHCEPNLVPRVATQREPWVRGCCEPTQLAGCNRKRIELCIHWLDQIKLYDMTLDDTQGFHFRKTTSAHPRNSL